MVITSRQNPRVCDAVRLRDRRHREKQGRILIDGARELARALQTGIKLCEAFVCPSLCTGPEAQHALAVLAEGRCEMVEVSEPVFAKLAFGARTEGVLVVAEMPECTLERLGERWGDSCTVAPGLRGGSTTATPTDSPTATPTEPPLVAVLEGVEKPGNIGAVLRSADGAGVSALILADPRTDLYNPNAIRASLGTIFTLPVCTADSPSTLEWLRRHHLAIVAARVDADRPYTAADFRGPTALVLGSEAEGLSPIWSAEDITAVRLPMLGLSDSLNVAAAAAVLFYEARRQRGQPECRTKEDTTETRRNEDGE